MIGRYVGLAALATAFLPVAASAQDRDNETGASTHVAALRDCRAIADPTARLACYDTQVPQFVAAADAGNVRVIDRATIRETRRRLFGLALPKINIFGGGDGDNDADEEEITTLATTLTSARPGPGGTMILRTEDGMVWQLDQIPSRLMTPRAGQPVEFRRASLGSYFVSINGQPGVRGRRVE